MVVSVNVAAREVDSVYCGNGEIDCESKGLGRMTPLLADGAVGLMVMVEKTRDSVATTAIVTRTGSVSVEEKLQ